MNSHEENDMDKNLLPEELAHCRQAGTYAIPPGYFETLAEDIMSKIHVPAGIEVPFTAPPVNYFDTFSDTVLRKLKAEHAFASASEIEKELEDIEPFLAAIPRTNVYSVPEGYFETFTVVRPAETKAPVISMPAQRPAAAWLTYAAAAVVTGIIAMGVLLNQNDNGPYAAAKPVQHQLQAGTHESIGQ